MDIAYEKKAYKQGWEEKRREQSGELGSPA